VAIKGQTINVTLDPRAYKELNKLENIIPTHIDLRNGHYTDNKYWESRPGFLHVVTVAPLPPVVIPPGVEPPIDLECDSVCPIGHFATAVYNGSTTIGGPAIRVRAISTAAVAYLVTATYFPSLGVIMLQWYDGESNTELGTVLDSVAYTLSDGDVLAVRSTTRVDDIIQFEALVNDVVVVGPVGDAGISESASCATFFALEGDLVTQEIVTVDAVAVTVNGTSVTITGL
jgi:hypothetical protein